MSKLAKALQSAAGNVGGDKLYVEDVFSTYLYTGNGSTQTITNGIDLDGEGGLVWMKKRSGIQDNQLFDSERGFATLTDFEGDPYQAGRNLVSNTTDAQAFIGYGFTSLNSNGFGLGHKGVGGDDNINALGQDYASWTFRKAPKFFDVVTWTGDGVNGRQIAHNLGSAPGCVIIKCTNDATRWSTWHRSLTAGYMLTLELTNAEFLISGSAGGGVSGADASTFTVSTGSSLNWVNGSGKTYVAYLFAHDAGGFGDDGEQNVISCGSYTGTGSTTNTVTLGYEPQWVMIKRSAGGTGDWRILDNMRGMPDLAGSAKALYANLTDAEDLGQDGIAPTATGFKFFATGAGLNASGSTYIYIAIRRPMKTPESGTEVFAPTVGEGTIPAYKTPNFTPDLAWSFYKPGYDDGTQSYPLFFSRLTGNAALQSANTRAELTSGVYAGSDYWNYMNGFLSGAYSSSWGAWMFRRAPGFMDVVAYTGDGTAASFTHNLSVTPELKIIQCREGGEWIVGGSVVTGGTRADYLKLYTTDAKIVNSTYWDTTDTASVFSVRAGNSNSNSSGSTYIAYLFASLPGVSKVGSYTGNGTSQTIDCGFSNGARFVLIKNTSIPDNWYVFDSVRGIVSGADPYIKLNISLAQASEDFIDPDSSGFAVTGSDPASNRNNDIYIYLAIA